MFDSSCSYHVTAHRHGFTIYQCTKGGKEFKGNNACLCSGDLNSLN